MLNLQSQLLLHIRFMTTDYLPTPGALHPQSDRHYLVWKTLILIYLLPRVTLKRNRQVIILSKHKSSNNLNLIVLEYGKYSNTYKYHFVPGVKIDIE